MREYGESYRHTATLRLLVIKSTLNQLDPANADDQVFIDRVYDKIYEKPEERVNLEKSERKTTDWQDWE